MIRRLLPLLALVAACDGGGAEPAPPTWHDDVAPLVEKHCLRCHTEGRIAPFGLRTHADAQPWAAAMAHATGTGQMPPFPVSHGEGCGDFHGAARLTDDEKAVFAAWAAADAPEGAATAPLEASPVEHLDPFDRLLDIDFDYAPTDRPDDYRCFIVDPKLDADRFLTAYEVVPGNPELVHHVILYTLDSALAEEQAAELDALDETPGYTCFGSSVVPESRPIAAWAPGTPPTLLPEGTGVRLLAGRKLVMQVHYYTAEAQGTDRTTMRLRLAEATPSEAFVYLVADPTMTLPAGEPDALFTRDYDLSNFGLPLGVFVRGVFPHMHLRGRSLRMEILREQGDECLVDVPAWDFHWQQLFWQQRPVYVFPTDTLRITCTYDTRADTEPVTWGDGTDDEMCLVGLFVTLH